MIFPPVIDAPWTCPIPGIVGFTYLYERAASDPWSVQNKHHHKMSTSSIAYVCPVLPIIVSILFLVVNDRSVMEKFIVFSNTQNIGGCYLLFGSDIFDLAIHISMSTLDV